MTLGTALKAAGLFDEEIDGLITDWMKSVGVMNVNIGSAKVSFEKLGFTYCDGCEDWHDMRHRTDDNILPTAVVEVQFGPGDVYSRDWSEERRMCLRSVALGYAPHVIGDWSAITDDAFLNRCIVRAVERGLDYLS